MLCFYFVVILISTILFFEQPESALDWVQFIIGNILQGLALPILAFVAERESNKTEKVIRDIHADLNKEITNLKDIHEDIHRIIKDRKD